MEPKGRYVEFEGRIFEMKKRTEVKILKIRGLKEKKKGTVKFSTDFQWTILFMRKEPAGDDDLRRFKEPCSQRGLHLNINREEKEERKREPGSFSPVPFLIPLTNGK